MVNEENTLVKRKNPVPEKDTINERSIYVVRARDLNKCLKRS